MFELFRSLVFALMLIAPGDVACNKPMTVCWVSFDNPAYVEQIKPSEIARLRALMEIKTLERQK